MESTADWLNYEFIVYDPMGTWSDKSGLYVFAKMDPNFGGWHPLYIGQTTSFAMCLQNHEKWEAALLMGATHIHARVEMQNAIRDTIEKQLIRFYRPKLNDTGTFLP